MKLKLSDEYIEILKHLNFSQLIKLFINQELTKAY